MVNRRSNRRGRVATWVIAAVLPWATTAWAQGSRQGALDSDLALVDSEVAALEHRFAIVVSEVGGDSLSRSPRVVSERYNEAQYAYLVRDFERCALLMHSLVENDDLAGDPRKPEAQWMLAECLYLSRNLLPAKSRYQAIVDEGAAHSHYGGALLKLIEIYGRTGDEVEFNRYYNTIVRSSQDTSPTALRIRYEMGKTLYRQGKLTDAQAIFAPFPRGSAYTPQAHYWSGAILVDEGRAASERRDRDLAETKYRQAILAFRETLELPSSTPEHEQVRDLCWLALARLQYELGEIDEALGSYAKVADASPHYPDALYELIWASLEVAAKEVVPEERNKRYEKALQSISIFNLAYPDDIREPALRLLAGHIRVRMEKYDEAIEKYETAATDFRDLKRKVDEIVGSSADPRVFFDQLVSGDAGASDFALAVPVPARKRATGDDRVAHAVAVTETLQGEQRALVAADDLLDVLDQAVHASDSVDLLQVYRLQRQQVASAESAALMLRSRLVDLEIAWLRATVPDAPLDGVSSQRVEATGAARAITDERQQQLDRLEALELQAQAVVGRLYDLEVAIDDGEARLTAVAEYLVGARRRGERTREEEVAARAEIDRETAELRHARDAIRMLKKRLEPRLVAGRIAANQAESTSRPEEATRRIADVERQLTGMRGGDSDFGRRIDGLRMRLARMQDQVGVVRGRLDSVESGEIEAIKREIGFQRRMVDELTGEGNEIADENGVVTGNIGRQAFIDVAGFYEDMLTRADMGVADVYWYRKEKLSGERKTLIREKNARLRALEDAFHEVLGTVQ